MEMEIVELKKENEKLKRSNLNYDNWRQWDSMTVYYFIMSTMKDGSLDEYDEKIKKEILECEYDGSSLEELELNDLKDMGIKKINVRKAVFKAVQRLTDDLFDKCPIPQSDTNYEGGNVAHVNVEDTAIDTDPGNI